MTEVVLCSLSFQSQTKNHQKHTMTQEIENKQERDAVRQPVVLAVS